MNITYLLLMPFLAYFIGSIPFGLILTRLAGLGDIRKIGSGNIGATNVLRTGNKPLAALTLILDGFKGALVVLVARDVAQNFLPLGLVDAGGVLPSEQSFFVTLMGMIAVLGHMFPIWLKFKGGKGVATFFGVTIALFPIIGITNLIIWLSTAFITRQSSLAALMATLFCAVTFWAYLLMAISGTDAPFIMATSTVMYTDIYSCFIITLLVAMVWLRHHENIARLLQGTEPVIGNRAV